MRIVRGKPGNSVLLIVGLVMLTRPLLCGAQSASEVLQTFPISITD